MATYIRIAGVDIERLKGSLSISNVLDQRCTASFVVVDRLGTANYYRGQVVEIFEGIAIPPFIHPLYNGFIDYPKRQRIAAGSGKLYWTIQCMDNRYLADKRIAAEAYATPGQTAGDIVTDLFTKYLLPEGVAIGTIEAGPEIAEMVINYSSVSNALDALAARADKIWIIDKNKELYFIDRGTSVAPFAITSDDILRDPEIASELTEASPLYRNRQFVRAGKDITILQTETRKGDGSAVAFTMGYPIAKLKVGVDAITVGGVNQTVGIKGIDTLKNVYWSKGDPIITFTVAPGNGVSVVCSYYGLYDIMVQADNLAEQLARQAVEGGTGIVDALDDFANVDTKDDALEAAQATLDHYGVIGKQFTFPIRLYGLEPGQMLTATHAPYGLTADELLITSVQISEVGPGELKYLVTAVEGPELGDWTGFFKALADIKADIMERITVGTDQVLIIMTNVTENWEQEETIAENVFACPVPSVALNPSVTLYPC